MKDFTDEAAAHIAAIRLAKPGTPEWRWPAALVEEAGEFQGAYNRWTGWSRRPGTRAEMIAKLAQVAICCWLAASTLDLELRPECCSDWVPSGTPEWQTVMQVPAMAGKFAEAYLAPGRRSHTVLSSRLENLLGAAYAAGAVLDIPLDEAVTARFRTDRARGWGKANA